MKRRARETTATRLPVRRTEVPHPLSCFLPSAYMIYNHLFRGRQWPHTKKKPGRTTKNGTVAKAWMRLATDCFFRTLQPIWSTSTHRIPSVSLSPAPPGQTERYCHFSTERQYSPDRFSRRCDNHQVPWRFPSRAFQGAAGRDNPLFLCIA